MLFLCRQKLHHPKKSVVLAMLAVLSCVLIRSLVIRLGLTQVRTLQNLHRVRALISQRVGVRFIRPAQEFAGEFLCDWMRHKSTHQGEKKPLESGYFSIRGRRFFL